MRSYAAACGLVLASASTLMPACAEPVRHKIHMGKRMNAHPHVPRADHRWGFAEAASSGPYGPNSADPYGPSPLDNPYNPYAAPGAAIRAKARINQYAPGVTNELAPDNIATATGGPAGGVPGFSGR